MSDAQPLIRAAGAIPAMPPTTTATTRVNPRSLHDNALGLFTPQAFEDDVVHRRFLGKHQLILSRPSSIHHVLVENTENYRRTNAGIRILRPLLGQGLLL